MTAMTPTRGDRVLITGAAGFVGTALCLEMLKRHASVVAVSRQKVNLTALQESRFRQKVINSLNAETNWDDALSEVKTVIHLAARVHVMHESARDALQDYRKINVQGTERLARAAAAAGVKRFVFLSSIKVNGEATVAGPFTDQDVAQPQDPYGVSKWEAEQVLKRIAAETGMEVVILRPPLVYGPNVKANFLRLLRWVDRGTPLPLAAVNNRRSMIYLGNLVDAIITCVDHPNVAGNTYLLSDGEDISTPELIGRIAEAFGKPARLWPLPQSALHMLGELTGKRSEVDRLLGSLQIDSSRFRQDAGWTPPFTLQQGIAQTVAWYKGASGQ